MHVQSCCFANLNQLVFDVLLAIADYWHLKLSNNIATYTVLKLDVSHNRGHLLAFHLSVSCFSVCCSCACLKLLRRNLSSVYHDLLETIQLSCISIFLWSSSTYNQNLYSPSSSQRTFALDVLLLASKLINSSENFILLLPVFGCNLIQRSRIKTKVSLQNRPYYFLAFFRRRKHRQALGGHGCKTGTSVR